MNLNQLRYAKAVAETGSFTSAAERCYVTQPTLSNAIAQLEQDFEAVWVNAPQRSAGSQQFTKFLGEYNELHREPGQG